MWGCAVFPAGEQGRVPSNESETRLGRVQYELINWGLRPRLGRTLVGVLETSARYREFKPGVGGSHWAIQIIRESYPGRKELGMRFSERPGRFLLKFLNNSAAGNSGFLFPIVNRNERRITFIVRQRGKLKKKYVYHSDAWSVFGWVGICLWPASDARYLRHDMARVARLFLSDAVGDGLLREGVARE